MRKPQIDDIQTKNGAKNTESQRRMINACGKASFCVPPKRAKGQGSGRCEKSQGCIFPFACTRGVHTFIYALTRPGRGMTDIYRFRGEGFPPLTRRPSGERQNTLEPSSSIVNSIRQASLSEAHCRARKRQLPTGR